MFLFFLVYFASNWSPQTQNTDIDGEMQHGKFVSRVFFNPVK